MQINIGFSRRKISAGPYYDKPDAMFGVKLAGEINEPCDISIPVKDFGVPSDDKVVREALKKVISKLALREPVYVGCMGGKGRTGLFLALLAKALGKPDPIGYVRAHYDPHAVETKAQEEYVKKFDVTPLVFDTFIASGVAFSTDMFRFFTGRTVT